LQELGVAFELSADDVFETGSEITAEMLRTDCASLYQAEVLHDSSAWHAIDIGENQERLPPFPL
jgi:hypothetical protein